MNEADDPEKEILLVSIHFLAEIEICEAKWDYICQVSSSLEYLIFQHVRTNQNELFHSHVEHSNWY